MCASAQHGSSDAHRWLVARRLCGLAALAALSLPAGCRSLPPRAEAASRVWPPAPAEPRIAYVATVTSPSDLGVSHPWWKRSVNFITGASRRDGFVRPSGIGVAADGSLLLADTGAHTVMLFDREHRRVKRWDSIGDIALVSPVAVARHGDTLFVADTGLEKVIAFDPEGALLFEITDVERPSGLAVNDSTLFVADAAAHHIALYDFQGSRRAQWGRRGNAPGEFNFPTHLASDAVGRLFVTDAMNARVQVLDRSGRCLAIIGARGDASGSFSSPKGIAVSPQGHVYVVDALFDNVQVFDVDGRFLMHWGAAGNGTGEFWLPAGIAIGPEGEILIADSYNRRIQIFQYLGEP